MTGGKATDSVSTTNSPADSRLAAGRVREWVWSILTIMACTGIAAIMAPYLELVDLVMVYLLGIVVTASRTSIGPSIGATLFSIAAFDFFFVPPRFTFAVNDVRHLVTFLVMFVVSIVISRLTIRLRQQAEAAQRARMQAEAESLRNTLLSSISHDLRTPLSAITGGVSTLLQEDVVIDKNSRLELLRTIQEEADRLNRTIKNILDMTRLESGRIAISKEWQSLEEIAGVVLNRLAAPLRNHPVKVSIPGNLPLVPMDGLLLEQVLMNLLENAIRYAPAGTALELTADGSLTDVTVSLADRGPGIPAGEEERIFEKFVRSSSAGGSVGLGLAICRTIINAHGGSIWAENREGGGAVFRFTLPAGGVPPAAEQEDAGGEP